MTKHNAEQLVISAIGTDRPGIVNELSQLIVQNNGNIDDSRMTVLGGEFAIILLISASPDELNKIESILCREAENLALSVISKRTGAPDAKAETIPYIVDVVAIDNPGIVYKLADFFSSRHINIQSMRTDRYQAPHTGTQMFAIEMIIAIPANLGISDLRDEFLDLCEDMNLDASIEAVR
mgnify:FL=1